MRKVDKSLNDGREGAEKTRLGFCVEKSRINPPRRFSNLYFHLRCPLSVNTELLDLIARYGVGVLVFVFAGKRDFPIEESMFKENFALF